MQGVDRQASKQRTKVYPDIITYLYRAFPFVALGTREFDNVEYGLIHVPVDIFFLMTNAVFLKETERSRHSR